MTDAIIQIEGLGKRYRIGAPETQVVGWRNNLKQLVGSSFSYLQQMLRPPTEEETLWALREVSVEVRRGEVLGVIGRNGAGKSTLLKILSRITEPTVGRAIIRGRIGSLLEVGTGFHPELTGRENTYLNGAILGMRRREIDRKFDEIVAFAGIERMIDTPVKRYSSGMYVRLAFAVAAHLEPEILIVDEVLAVGDLNFQKKCLGKMEEVAQTGRTVLFVSHNMPAVSRLCTRALLLDGGRVIEDGSVTHIMTTYMATMLGTVPEKQWSTLQEAPGTDEVKLMHIGAFNTKGQSASHVSVEETVQIKLRYYVSSPGIKLRCALVLTTQGINAFSTTEPTENVHPSCGFYESTVVIPGNLLTEGEYTINASIFSSKGVKHRFVTLNEVIGFQVFDPLNGDSARGDYAEAMSGVVRPLLPWQNNFIESKA